MELWCPMALNKTTYLIPISVALATLVASVFFHTVHLGIQDDRLRSETRVVSSNFAARLETHLEARLNAAELLRSHFNWRGAIDSDAFRTETELFHQLFGDLQALNWVDAQGVIRIVTPEDGNAAALGLDLTELAVPSETLARANLTGALQLTQPIGLAQGGTGFVAYLPLEVDGRRTGYLNIVFRAAPLMENALSENPINNYSIRVDDAGDELFALGETSKQAGLIDVNVIRVGGREWHVSVAPLPSYVLKANTYVDELILLLGSLMAIVLGILSHLAIERQYSLVRSQNRFQQFASASSDWFWEMDENMIVTWCSDGIELFFGVERKDFIGRKRGDFRHSVGDDKNWQNHFDDLNAKRAFKDFVYAIMVNGEQKWVRTSGMPTFDESGEFTGYRGVATDITDTVRARSQVEKSNQFLASAVEGLDELFSLWDADDKLVLGNRMFRELNKKTVEVTEPGTSFESFLRANIEAGLVSGIEGNEEAYITNSLQRRREFQADPFEVVRTDGVILQLHEQRLESGGLVTVGQDVTKQRQKDQALRESQKRLALAVDTLTIWDWDLEAQNYYISPGFAHALGYSDEEFREMMCDSLALIVHPDDVDDYLNNVKAHLKDTSVTFSSEYRLRTKSGVYRWFLARGQASANDQGRATRSTGVLTDITDRIHLEDQLHQSRKMEAIGQLTGGIAHDFNNLLAVVLGNAELLQDIVTDKSAVPLVGSIIRASERGAELTQRLLAFSRRQPLRPVALDLSSLMHGLPALLKPVLGETVDLKLTVEPNIWLALADPGQVENALLNLALNSRDAMPTGGTISISCHNKSFDEEQSDKTMVIDAGQYVVLSVTDTGTGMSEETIEHACEPFFTTKGVGEGSGLGLSMVLGFAQQSGGQVSISSELGVGTTVKLFLPRAVAHDSVPSSKEREEPPKGKGQTVLVVEDDPAVRDLAVQMLTNLGYTPIAAEDATSGKTILDQHPETSLILSDVVLSGGMNGPQFVQEVQAMRPDIKVIFMSGHPAEALGKSGEIVAGPILLNKPFRVSDLAKAIEAS